MAAEIFTVPTNTLVPSCIRVPPEVVAPISGSPSRVGRSTACAWRSAACARRSAAA